MSNGVRFCSKCDYQAEDGYDMVGHKWGEHDDEDLESLRCNSCNQTFSFLRDLMYHKKEKHVCTWNESDQKSDQIVEEQRDTGIENESIPSVCKFCEDNFQTKGDFMKHKKDKHREKVQMCWKFVSGNCPFGDNRCWFIHNEDTESISYNCKLCGKYFSTLPELMKHKKENHSQLFKFVRIDCVYMENKIVGLSMKNPKKNKLS